MSGPVELMQYTVKDWIIEETQSGLVVTLVLGRKILNQLLTTYLPTSLLIVIVHTTNYFKDFFFEAVVTINLTCMLVLVTLFISVCESLPNTSYIKMMDYWFIFNLILPFIEVLLHTYMELLNEDDITKQSKPKETGKVFHI